MIMRLVAVTAPNEFRMMLPGRTRHPAREKSFSQRGGVCGVVPVPRLPGRVLAALGLVVSMCTTAAHADDGFIDEPAVADD